MNEPPEPVEGPTQPQRVVTLPCGHLVEVDREASWIALSGPVLNHQAECRPPSRVVSAWFLDDGLDAPIPLERSPSLPELRPALPIAWI